MGTGVLSWIGRIKRRRESPLKREWGAAGWRWGAVDGGRASWRRSPFWLWSNKAAVSARGLGFAVTREQQGCGAIALPLALQTRRVAGSADATDITGATEKGVRAMVPREGVHAGVWFLLRFKRRSAVGRRPGSWGPLAIRRAAPCCPPPPEQQAIPLRSLRRCRRWWYGNGATRENPRTKPRGRCWQSTASRPRRGRQTTRHRESCAWSMRQAP